MRLHRGQRLGMAAGLLAFFQVMSHQALAADPEAVSLALMQRAGNIGANSPHWVEDRPRIEKAVLDFYEARDWRPIWFNAQDPGNQRLKHAIGYLATSADEGLNPAHYGLPVSALSAERMGDDTSAATLAAIDMAVTSQLLTYARDVAVGRRAPSSADPNVFLPVRSYDLRAFLDLIADPRAEIPVLLNRQPPKHPEYRALKAALVRFRGLGETQVPAAIPDGAALKPGATDDRVAVLAARLVYWAIWRPCHPTQQH